VKELGNSPMEKSADVRLRKNVAATESPKENHFGKIVKCRKKIPLCEDFRTAFLDYLVEELSA
jgi:hypothetical protein